MGSDRGNDGGGIRDSSCIVVVSHFSARKGVVSLRNGVVIGNRFGFGREGKVLLLAQHLGFQRFENIFSSTPIV